MKKTVYGILAASMAGALLSSLLMMIHYYPDSNLAAAACSGGISGSCGSLASSDYSVLFGIPLAALGLFFYLTVSFIVLTADYAEGPYPGIAAAAVLFLAVIGSAANIPMAVIMILSGEFCSYCAATYGVNITILILSFISVRSSAAEKGSGIRAFYRSLLLQLSEDNPHLRAVKSLFIIFISVLAFSVISTDRLMNEKTSEIRSAVGQAEDFVARFMSQPPEELNLPGDPIVFGSPDAGVEIIVFTDYLCSACYQFYQIEKKLLKKYSGQVRFLNYHYPLDTTCNPAVKRSVYPGSCEAARAVSAADAVGIADAYLVNHFKNYEEYKKKGYNAGSSSAALEALADRDQFLKKTKSEEAGRRISGHIEAAVKLKIDATPTLFIASRRIVGIPPMEILDALIKSQLKKK